MKFELFLADKSADNIASSLQSILIKNKSNIDRIECIEFIRPKKEDPHYRVGEVKIIVFADRGGWVEFTFGSGTQISIEVILKAKDLKKLIKIILDRMTKVEPDIAINQFHSSHSLSDDLSTIFDSNLKKVIQKYAVMKPISEMRHGAIETLENISPSEHVGPSTYFSLVLTPLKTTKLAEGECYVSITCAVPCSDSQFAENIGIVRLRMSTSFSLSLSYSFAMTPLLHSCTKLF